MASSDNRLRVIVCGFGRAGRIHTGNLLHNPMTELVAVLEIEAAHMASAEYLRQLGVSEPKKLLRSPDDLESILSGDEADAIVVTTPTPDHEPFVKAGLLAGKAVFCEKPLANSLHATSELYKLAAKQGSPLFCSFNRRFDPTLLALKKTYQSGALGKPLVLKTIARDYPVPSIAYLRTSGGMVHDCGIHEIDITCWMVENYPDEVFAMGFSHDPEIGALGDYDTLAMTMKFSKPSVFMVTVDLSRHGTYGYDQRLEMHCEGGMLESQLQRQNGLAITAAPSAKGFNVGTTVSPILSSFPQRYLDSYRDAMAHFVRFSLAQLDRKKGKGILLEEELISGKEVIYATLIADALDQSLKLGVPVKINYETLSFNQT